MPEIVAWSGLAFDASAIFLTNSVGSGGYDEENQQSVVHGDLAYWQVY